MSQRTTWWAVTVDCNEPRQVVEFWSAVLDCAVIEPSDDRSGWFRLQSLGSRGPYMNFQPSTEPKIGKLRVHVDVLVDDLDAAVDRVVAFGGSDTGTREELPRGRIAVMQDPEGNEFCVLASPALSPPAGDGGHARMRLGLRDQKPRRNERPLTATTLCCGHSRRARRLVCSIVERARPREAARAARLGV